jgi:hypothetical protein
MKKITIVIVIFILGVWLYFYFGNRKRETPGKFDLSLAQKLGRILHADQSMRKNFDSIRQLLGPNSIAFQNRLKEMVAIDSANLLQITHILDSCGWLGPDEIGEDGSLALFLVIQHGDQKTQEKYLPMMREAVKAGKAPSHDLAMLEDRVLTGRGELQKYGSQVGYDKESGTYYLLPLANPEKVDSLRKTVDLDSISVYLNHWQIKWDVENYKRELPSIIAKERKRKEQYSN